jgi:hypothetical protein
MARNEHKKVLEQLSEAYQKVLKEEYDDRDTKDAGLPEDWMERDWEGRENSFDNVNLKDEVVDIQNLIDNFLGSNFEADEHDQIAKALHNVKTLLSDTDDDGKYSREPSNIGMPGAQY